MVIVAIEQRDPDRLVAKALGGREPTEPSADDDNMRLGHLQYTERAS